HLILVPKNADVDFINNIIMSLFLGNATKYLSANSIDKTFEGYKYNYETFYSIEFLNNLKMSGISLYKLLLKIGTPIMLLHNLSLAESLCNGLCLICYAFTHHVIEAELITKKYTGTRVFLFCIVFTSVANLSFILKCHQFLVHPVFAITINKAQGQTLNSIGVYLPTPVFSHGQLYIACSRATFRTNLKIMLTDHYTEIGHTQNTVYPKVLL
ncbi:1383_t:CDS:1, partial [Cetraspora pellucida]